MYEIDDEPTAGAGSSGRGREAGRAGDPMQASTTALLTRRQIAAMAETHIRHPWNAESDVYLKRLSPATGLRRLALAVTRVPPGRESFLYHRHECCEEFLFILSGRGRAEIGAEVFEVAAGDFMGFPAPDGPPHHLGNPYDEDLVYLMGGESGALDIGHFPRLGRLMVFATDGVRGIAAAACQGMNWSDWRADEPEADRRG